MCVQILPLPPHFLICFILYNTFLYIRHCTIPFILGSHPPYPTYPPTPSIATNQHPLRFYFYLHFHNNFNSSFTSTLTPNPSPPPDFFTFHKNFNSSFTPTLTPQIDPRPPPPPPLRNLFTKTSILCLHQP